MCLAIAISNVINCNVNVATIAIVNEKRLH